MSEIATIQQSAGKNAVKFMESQIAGRVLRVRKYDQHFYTAIITPAPDLYSKPSVIEIRSKQRFSDKDEDVRITAKLGGYEGKPYPVVDRDTGEKRMLTPVNIFLDLVET